MRSIVMVIEMRAIGDNNPAEMIKLMIHCIATNTRPDRIVIIAPSSLPSSPLERVRQNPAPHRQGRHSIGSGWSRLATPTTAQELFSPEPNSPLSSHGLRPPGLRQKMSSSWLGHARFWLGQRKRQRRRELGGTCEVSTWLQYAASTNQLAPLPIPTNQSPGIAM